MQAALTIALRQRTKLGARAGGASGRASSTSSATSPSSRTRPSGHLVLWERYLVYAVALGVSEELVRGLALRVPEVAESMHYARWYARSRTAARR